jgi:putative polyketide hydroxylase
MGIHAGDSLVDVLARRGDGGWLTRKMRARAKRGGASRTSPASAARCTQDELEPILLRAALARGVDARFSTELVSLAQDAGGVTATLSDGRTLRARYLIAADGSRSTVRKQLGIARSGSRTYGHQLNVLFRADLAALVHGREFSMCLVDNPRVRGLIASLDNASRWVIHISYDPSAGGGASDFTPERCADLVRAAIGIPDLAVEVLGISPWQSAVRLAERMRDGRVFLAGDAAHAMPPWGGFGANTAIQDAHNLAWKLALVLRGEAGDALLATYESERMPVARAVAELSGSMSGDGGLIAIPKRTGMLGALWRMRRMFGYMKVGYGYASPAIAVEDGDRPGPHTTALDGRPGTRVPHVWIEPGQSTLDLVGRGGFTLLAGPDANRWCEASPVPCVRVAEHRALGIRRDGALLVRPDGFIAWRSRSGGPASELVSAYRRVLDAAA